MILQAIVSCLLLGSVYGSELMGNLQILGEQGPKLPIDEMNGYPTPEKFYTEYINKSKPLLMKGAALNQPGFKKWNDAYFLSKIRDSPSGNILVELHKKQPLRQKVEYLSFRDFLKDYNTSDYYMIDFIPKPFREDIIVPDCFQCKEFVNGGFSAHIMWFSSGGTRGILHKDPYDNFICSFKGKKRFVMVDLKKYSWIAPLLIDLPGHSSLDVDSVDLQRWPFLEGLEYRFADMVPGDCLYIPIGMPHQVRSSNDGPNLAVSIWWRHYKGNGAPKECVKKPRTDMTFDKAIFTEMLNRTKVECKNVVFSLMKMGVTTESTIAPILAVGNDALIKNERFQKATKELFEASDVDGDGKITEKDDAAKLTFKRLKTIDTALEHYNMAVFYLREEYVGGYLPKYFWQFEGLNFTPEISYGFLPYSYDDPPPEELYPKEDNDDDDDSTSELKDPVAPEKDEL